MGSDVSPGEAGALLLWHDVLSKLNQVGARRHLPELPCSGFIHGAS